MWTRFLCAFLAAGCAMAQTPASSSPPPATGQAAAPAPAAPATLTIPSGTKVPLALKQAISTKTAK
ncbi:MAG: hypothetical protein HY233_14020, partial [Acidobacteriales bacterium]|nr:hypothetical protein [Terriglobales bacterium]